MNLKLTNRSVQAAIANGMTPEMALHVWGTPSSIVPPAGDGLVERLHEHWERTTWPIFTEAADEIERLRAWKEEATQVIEMWEQCYDAVEAKGSHARPGEFKSKHVLKWIKGE